MENSSVLHTIRADRKKTARDTQRTAPLTRAPERSYPRRRDAPLRVPAEAATHAARSRTQTHDRNPTASHQPPPSPWQTQHPPLDPTPPALHSQARSRPYSSSSRSWPPQDENDHPSMHATPDRYFRYFRYFHHHYRRPFDLTPALSPSSGRKRRRKSRLSIEIDVFRGNSPLSPHFQQKIPKEIGVYITIRSTVASSRKKKPVVVAVTKPSFFIETLYFFEFFNRKWWLFNRRWRLFDRKLRLFKGRIFIFNRIIHFLLKLYIFVYIKPSFVYIKRTVLWPVRGSRKQRSPTWQLNE